MIVFAERARRSESLMFRIFYVFSRRSIPAHRQGRAGGQLSARSRGVGFRAWWWSPRSGTTTRRPCSDRDSQIAWFPLGAANGSAVSSSMNFVSLVAHGLSAISVYSDVVGVRLLVMSILLASLAVAGIVAAVVVRLATTLAVPGWASYTVGIFLVLLFQAVMAAFVFSFAILGSRHGSTFLPRRDYSFFIGSVWTLHGVERALAPRRLQNCEATNSPSRGR